MRSSSDRGRQLLTDDEIIDAALWRLSDWTAAEVARGTQVAVRLRQRDGELSADDPAIARELAAFERRGDRRSGWGALMALLALHADATDDVRTFLLAGFEVVTAWRNSRAGSSNGALSKFSEMIREYQANRPAATADDLFNFWCSIVRAHEVLEDYDQERDVLIYVRNGRLAEVNRESFGRQFRRIRRMAEPAHKKSEGSSRTQRVVVRRAA